MFSVLIRLLFAAGTGCFVLALPVWKTAVGATLRRVAGFCVVLAFLPSLLVGLFVASSSPRAAAAPSPSILQRLLADLEGAAVILVVVVLAYIVLQIRARGRARSTPTDPFAAFLGRGGGKRRVDPDRRARRRVAEDEESG